MSAAAAPASSTAERHMTLKHEIEELRKRLKDAEEELAALDATHTKAMGSIIGDKSAIKAALVQATTKWSASEKKDLYNENKRIKRAAARRAAAPVELAPLSSVVPTDPPRLRELWRTDVVETPKDSTQIIHIHTKSWDRLAPRTLQSYLTYGIRACNSGLSPGMQLTTDKSITDPNVIIDHILALGKSFDVWKTMIEITDPAISLATRNQLHKGFLGCCGQWLRDHPPNDKKWPTVALWGTIAHKINNRSKHEISDNFAEQRQSPEAAANTVRNWDEWELKAADFIDENIKPERTFEQQRDAMLIAVYSLIPPVRNNWANMEVADAPPLPSERRNVIVFEPPKTPKSKGAIVTYWGDFKNRESFAGELPLKIPITTAKLLEHMRSYKQRLTSKWFLPTTGWGADKHYSENGLGQHLGDLTMEIVNKRFTSTRMRASFITTMHRKNNSKGILDLKKLKIAMRQLHQKNIEVHFSYAKHLIEGGEMAHFDAEDD